MRRTLVVALLQRQALAHSMAGLSNKTIRPNSPQFDYKQSTELQNSTLSPLTATESQFHVLVHIREAMRDVSHLLIEGTNMLQPIEMTPKAIVVSQTYRNESA